MKSGLTKILSTSISAARLQGPNTSSVRGMSSFGHLFQDQAESYAEFRPAYPKELYEAIYRYLGASSPTKIALDIATGSGQAAVELAQKFDQVIATDPSENQLKHAAKRANIKYRVGTAENTDMTADSVDLLTVAQALHWFDHPRFFREAHRVLKPGGVLACWGYGLPTVKGNQVASDLIQNFAYGQAFLGPYWDERRRLVDEEYASVCPSSDLFVEIVRERMQDFTDCTIDHFMNYLSTWSSYTTYRKTHPDKEDPLFGFKIQFLEANGKKDAAANIPIAWPIFLILARAKL